MKDTKVLLHVNTISQVGDVINGAPIRLPANEPVELDSFVASAVLNHIGHQYGIVEVNQVKTGRGIEWDVDEALERAKSYLEECDRATVQFYVRQQMEDRIAAGKPALPPTGLALDVIKARGVSLRKGFGLTPVGWTDPGESLPSIGVQSAKSDDEINSLRSIIASQNQQIADLGSKFELLMKHLNGESEPATELEVVG